MEATTSGTVHKRQEPAALSVEQWERIAGLLELSPQQARIVQLTLEGKQDKQIAREMGLSFGTVRMHLSRVFDRVGVPGRMELAALVFARAAALPAPGEEGQ